jgi:hypothetical protein
MIPRNSALWIDLSLDLFVGRKWGIDGEFYVEVKYTDACVGQPTWATFHVTDVS